MLPVHCIVFWCHRYLGVCTLPFGLEDDIVNKVNIVHKNDFVMFVLCE